MRKSGRGRVISLAQAQLQIHGHAGENSITVMQRGTLDVALSFPRHPNQQRPHSQDEIYFVVRGKGLLFYDGETEPFESGDFLFVAAGTEHRFEDHSEDLAVWRVFYGPQKGEIPVTAR